MTEEESSERHKRKHADSNGNDDVDVVDVDDLPPPPNSGMRIQLIRDPKELLRYGVCRVRLPAALDCDEWAERLSQIPLTAMTMEGDLEYPLYQNILEQQMDDFPFDAILQQEEDETEDGEEPFQLPSIPYALKWYFDVSHPSVQLRLDDAFGVHYNLHQYDTTGKKHQDPSDITINICLQKSEQCQGSHVLFHGIRSLPNTTTEVTVQQQQQQQQQLQKETEEKTKTELPQTTQLFFFLVEQIPGTATIHYGNHPHETTAMQRQDEVEESHDNNYMDCHPTTTSRTNVILTFWYTDRESDVATRSCYV
ncbi:hypothetical protein IV203_032338 [Nitzschia inconspicua]|uniref:Uncharacterized protein n=1 Tax=Nitzschia inconspicua TaxID=303405 RepID=A0A9K3KJB9_9STRA|nr:hypothetical protein IV203_032338 [Nitzschia inconspicua]